MNHKNDPIITGVRADIWSVLTQRCDVVRPTRVQNPVTGEWQPGGFMNNPEVLATNVRCRLLPQDWQEDQEHLRDSLTEITGTAIFAASADIRPGDRLTINRTAYVVLSRGQHLDDFHGNPSHQEWTVTQA